MEIEDKLIIAKLADKIKLCKIQHKIENTEFLYLNKELFLFSNRNSKKNGKPRISI